jgi:nicotinate dehydrogenase subunit A
VSGGYDLNINGKAVHVHGDGTKPLLSVLRDELGLRGSRFGCGTEQCGACMVLIDGEPSYSCARAVESIAGKTVTTVEGLSSDRALSPLQQAFLDEQAGQCGYCLSGILISASALLARNPRPSRGEIAAALDRHLCRCGVHNRIIRAVARAALASEASGQRGNSKMRAPDTRPEPGSSARAALASDTRSEPGSSARAALASEASGQRDL